jgi:hypothetical protein
MDLMENVWKFHWDFWSFPEFSSSLEEAKTSLNVAKCKLDSSAS